jgi:hypothetical protein
MAEKNDVPAFLCSLEDGTEVDIVTSLLESHNIPVMKKRRAAGEYLKIYMGISFYEVDIYVPSKLLIVASEILSGEPIIEEIEETDISDEECAGAAEKDIKKYVAVWIIRVFQAPLFILGIILNAIFTFIKNKRRK